MTNFIQLISLFITGSTMTIIVFDFLGKTFEKKYSSKLLYFFSSCVFVVLFCLSLLISTPIIRIFFPAVLPIIACILLYKKFSIILVVMLIFSIEFFEIFIEITTALLFSNYFQIMPTHILRSLIIFFIYQVALYFFKNSRFFSNRIKQSPTIFLLPLFSIFIINVLIVYTVNYYDSGLVILSSIACIGLLFSNITMFHLFYKISKLSAQEIEYQMKVQQTSLQYEYMKSIEEKNLETKKIFHDIKKHVGVLSTLESINTQKRSNYIEQILKEVNFISVPEYTKSSIINILVHDKVRIAEREHLNFNINCENIDFSFMEEMDQTTLLSNLLNNAFEECLYSNNNHNFIELTICEINEFLIVNIINSCGNPNQKSASKHMGIGLLNVKDVVKKYDGEILITKANTEPHFEVQISFLSKLLI